MSAAPAAKRVWTEAEYLAMDRASPDVKHQLVDGEVYAMSGGTYDHAAVIMKLHRYLDESLDGRSCVGMSNDLRIKAEGAEFYSYPDASVICGPARFDDEHADTVVNPTVVFEVLSPSTEAFDRGVKFARHARILSLTQYVLVLTNVVGVEVFTRVPGPPESWSLRRYGAGDSFALDLGAGGSIELGVDALYANAQSVPRE
ncbi:MAG: Uma2 family endonuclease [Polyangiales bacterium]